MHVAGAESEMELAYAGLHQVCGPMLDHLARLAKPQRALAVALGLKEGRTPDKFLVGLAALGLMAVEWHTSKILSRPGIKSRRGLRAALADTTWAALHLG